MKLSGLTEIESRTECRPVTETMMLKLRVGKFLTASIMIFGPRLVTQRLPSIQPMGRILAQRWCASCHRVSNDEKTANSDIPTSHGGVSSQSHFFGIVALARVMMFLTISGPAAVASSGAVSAGNR
jgi:hypothetical protein